MDTGKKELQFIRDAVFTAKAARGNLIKQAAASGKVVDITKLRQLDMDIKQCEAEIRRSTCH